MATETTIQQKINKGYRIAAKHLGHLFAHYRPTSTGSVLVNFNIIDELMMAYDPDPAFGFIKPQGYKDDTYYGLVDLTTVATGDYFYDFDQCTFFVANFEPLKSVMLIRCTNVVSVYRPASGNGYGGNTGPELLLEGWPVSILAGTKGERNVAGLPESVRPPWAVIHIPQFQDVIIRYGDIFVDDLGRRYVVATNQNGYLGWHITASLEIA